MKRLFLGLGITSAIILVYFLIYFFNYKTIDFVDFIVIPFLIYFGTFASLKFYTAIFSKKVYEIQKYIAVVLLSFWTIFTIFANSNIENAFPLIIIISILFNWNATEQNKNENTKNKIPSNKNTKIYYLIHFIVIFVFYICISMIFYRRTTDDNAMLSIFIFGVALAIEYWLIYLFYKYILKNNKPVKIFKITFLLITAYMIYFFRDSILNYTIWTLISISLLGVISLTIHSLIEQKIL